MFKNEGIDRGINTDEIKALVDRYVKLSSPEIATGNLGYERRKAEHYYYGRPFGNERPFRSRVVMTTVAETIEGVMPDLIDMFLSSDQIGRCDPVGDEDKEEAKQKTEMLNYLVLEKNDGFRVIYTAIKDALWKKNGVIKVWWEEKIDKTITERRGLSYEELAVLMASRPDIKIVGTEQYTEKEIVMSPVLDPVTKSVQMHEQVAEVNRFNIKIMRETVSRGVKIANVAPEGFMIPVEQVSIMDSPFVGERTYLMRGDLVAMGFDPEVIERLPTISTPMAMNIERQERFEDERGDTISEVTGVPEHEYIEVVECYLKVDLEGDGLLEKIKVLMAGGEILEIEPAENVIFISGTAIMMPHKHYGRSLADLTMDLQLIDSTLMRSFLDNFYNATDPMMGSVEGSPNWADLLNRRPGGQVRMKKQGDVWPLITSQLPPESFNMLETMEGIRERRTGVVRYNQGLDADSLNKTKGGMQQQLNTSMKKIKLYARCIAETMIKPMCQGVLDLYSMYQDEATTIRRRNRFVKVDPTKWNNKMDVVVEVGLGTGDQGLRIANLMRILELQVQAFQQQGGEGPLVTVQHLYNSLCEIVKASGYRSVEQFFMNPSEAPPQEPKEQPEDPIMVGLQMEDARENKKMAIDVQKHQDEMDIKQGQLFRDLMEIFAKHKKDQQASAASAAAMKQAASPDVRAQQQGQS